MAASGREGAAQPGLRRRRRRDWRETAAQARLVGEGGEGAAEILRGDAKADGSLRRLCPGWRGSVAPTIRPPQLPTSMSDEPDARAPQPITIPPVAADGLSRHASRRQGRNGAADLAVARPIFLALTDHIHQRQPEHPHGQGLLDGLQHPGGIVEVEHPGHFQRLQAAACNQDAAVGVTLKFRSPHLPAPTVENELAPPPRRRGAASRRAGADSHCGRTAPLRPHPAARRERWLPPPAQRPRGLPPRSPPRFPRACPRQRRCRPRGSSHWLPPPRRGGWHRAAR